MIIADTITENKKGWWYVRNPCKKPSLLLSFFFSMMCVCVCVGIEPNYAISPASNPGLEEMKGIKEVSNPMKRAMAEDCSWDKELCFEGTWLLLVTPRGAESSKGGR